MEPIEYISKKPEDTIRLGARLARFLKPQDIVCLEGNLGSGKTTLTKGIAKGLGIRTDLVNSPTFVLLNRYEGKLPLYHFDLYRLDNPREILSIGYEEFLYGEGVAVVEWADKLKTLKPKDYVLVKLFHKKGDERKIRISAKGLRAEKIISSL